MGRHGVVKVDTGATDASAKAHDRVAVNAGQALDGTNRAPLTRALTMAIRFSIGRMFMAAGLTFVETGQQACHIPMHDR